MTYQQIYQAVQNIRFGDSNILSTPGGVKDWIKAREEEVWQFANWPLKESGSYNVTISGSGFSLPSAFTEFSAGMELFSDLGDKLEYMEPGDLEGLINSYASSNVPSGNPSFWTIDSTSSAGVVTLAVKMDQSDTGATYKVRGWSGPVCRSSTSAYKLGTMSADTDLPWWDTNHYFLVSGALALGKRQMGDPTWQADEQDFQTGLQRLQDTVIGSRQSLRQWSGNYGDYTIY